MDFGCLDPALLDSHVEGLRVKLIVSFHQVKVLLPFPSLSLFPRQFPHLSLSPRLLPFSCKNVFLAPRLHFRRHSTLLPTLHNFLSGVIRPHSRRRDNFFPGVILGVSCFLGAYTTFPAAFPGAYDFSPSVSGIPAPIPAPFSPIFLLGVSFFPGVSTTSFPASYDFISGIISPSFPASLQIHSRRLNDLIPSIITTSSPAFYNFFPDSNTTFSSRRFQSLSRRKYDFNLDVNFNLFRRHDGQRFYSGLHGPEWCPFPMGNRHQPSGEMVWTASQRARWHTINVRPETWRFQRLRHQQQRRDVPLQL